MPERSSSRSYLRQDRRALRAASGRDSDLAHTFRALLGCGIGGRFSPSTAIIPVVHRSDDKEVDSGCDEQKRDQAVEEKAVGDVTTVDISGESTEIRFAADCSDQWCKNVPNERGYDWRQKRRRLPPRLLDQLRCLSE